MLFNLQEALAIAVIDDPHVNEDSPLNVHWPDETVVVPNEISPLNTSTVEPFASELVPETDVAPNAIGDVIIGVEDTS